MVLQPISISDPLAVEREPGKLDTYAKFGSKFLTPLLLSLFNGNWGKGASLLWMASCQDVTCAVTVGTGEELALGEVESRPHLNPSFQLRKSVAVSASLS